MPGLLLRGEPFASSAWFGHLNHICCGLGRSGALFSSASSTGLLSGTRTACLLGTRQGAALPVTVKSYFLISRLQKKSSQEEEDQRSLHAMPLVARGGLRPWLALICS